MIVRSIGRVCAKQPITLLEVNTLGHVICSFVVYLLWWHKPREVKEPTVIRSADDLEFCAFLYTFSRISGGKPNRRFMMDKWIVPKLETYASYPSSTAEEAWLGWVESLQPGGNRTQTSRDNDDSMLVKRSLISEPNAHEEPQSPVA